MGEVDGDVDEGQKGGLTGGKYYTGCGLFVVLGLVMVDWANGSYKGCVGCGGLGCNKNRSVWLI